jgi:hypothetical protein
MDEKEGCLALRPVACLCPVGFCFIGWKLLERTRQAVGEVTVEGDE